MSNRAYEFETSCDATLRETWRVTVPANLAGDELVDRIADELHAGRCEFVGEEAEDERDREVQEDSIEEEAPAPESAYTATNLGAA